MVKVCKEEDNEEKEEKTKGRTRKFKLLKQGENIQKTIFLERLERCQLGTTPLDAFLLGPRFVLSDF